MLPALLPLLLMTQSSPDPTLTVAEASDYTATASSAQVMELIERINQVSDIMRLGALGQTSQGQPIPLVILANPPIANAATGRAASAALNKPICFIMANIHAGEIEGKEACLMLMRELALDDEHPLLKDLIIVFAPNYNADGNDKFDAVEKNRPGQAGPAQVGIRANAQGLDLNRDYIKLEAPESRALAKFLTDWDPHLTIDCHTTNGSAHRYVLTYEAPLNPSGHPAPIAFVRDELLPAVTKRIKERTGYDVWFYGNFNRDNPPTIWETYSAQPRFGGPYQGLRNQMSVLSEAYSYASYKERVIATREFIREILQFVAENKQKVIEINAQARRETLAWGENPQPSDVVGIRHRVAAFSRPVVVKGYENVRGGEGGAAIDPHVDHGPPKDYTVVHLGRFEPTLSVRRPYAYIIPPQMEKITEKLQQHGITLQPFEGSATVEVYAITKIDHASNGFQNHHTVRLDVTATLEQREFPHGSMIVRAAQPLGTLAVYLLEPQSEDGLATWNFFDEQLKVGGEIPVVRVRAANDLR